MKLTDDTLKLLALWMIPGIGPRRITRLLSHFENPEDIFTASPKRLSEILNIGLDKTRLIPDALNTKQFKDEIRQLEKYDLDVVNFTQPEYPKLLKEIYNAPPILFLKGKIDFNSGLPIAFVGSRKASFAGKNLCEKIIKRLSEIHSDIVIISGLALGIDSTAHNAALDNGLKTVSVLAGGLSSIYPARNKNLAERVSQNGALVTEFPTRVQPSASNFPLRNRIISGLSKGTVVVEAGERSGASITAGYTLEQNRELFAFPGQADSPFYRGTNRMIQKGQAKLILDAEDILEEFLTNIQLSIKDSLTKDSCSKPVLNVEEKVVLDYLQNGCMHQNALSSKSGLPIHRILPALTSLELKGLIVSKPGSVFQIIEK